MAERIDYKTIALGIVIYIAGVFAIGAAAKPLLGAEFVDRYAFDFIVSALVTFCAGYIVRRRTAVRTRNHSVILALVLLACNLILTISDLFSPVGDPLHINLLYDAVITISILSGGWCAARRLRDI